MARRQAWAEAQPGLMPERLVFIDETGASTKMARRYGRAPRGQRCQAAIPHGHWKTTTFIGALRSDGITAPMVLDGAMHGDAVLAYVEQMLVPTLKPADAELRFLPPYSPDFNPIEMAFAKLKALLKKAAARSVDDLHDAIATAIDTVTQTECQNYFTAAGYDRA